MAEFKSWSSYRDFAHGIRRQRRYIRSKEDEEFLHEVLRTSRARVRRMPKGFSLWRAQLDHGLRKAYQDGKYMGELECALTPERMKPLSERAKEGRANPKGIPVLYLSTRAETAMSEVRPWIGLLVSCAVFETTRELRLVDLSVTDGDGFTFYFEQPDATKKEEAVWADIDAAFSEPVTSQDDTADYGPTQVISEWFRTNGFDGVAYKSAFGKDGYNVALFNLEDARLKSCTLHAVRAAHFQFDQIDNPYWVEDDGTIKTMTIEVLGPADPSPNK